MSSAEPATPRKRPCASCPYRLNVPSGIWHPDEYDKLREYDGETFEQPTSVFLCHQGQGDICSGWAAHNDPTQLLALRIGVLEGTVDPEVFDYTTDVPLFASGAAAADHGQHGCGSPSPEAAAAIRKLIARRDLDTSAGLLSEST